MTKREMQLEKDLSKAIIGGKEMLERAKWLDDNGIELVSSYDRGSENWRIGIIMCGFAYELRSYYKKMFN